MTTPSERAERIAEILDGLRRDLKGREQAARVVGMDVDDPATGHRGDPDFYRRNTAIAGKVRARLDALESLLTELHTITSERDAAVAEIARLTEFIEGAADTINLILPLAKSYAYANRVGSNQEYIKAAEGWLQLVCIEQHHGDATWMFAMSK